jgi:uncharacterized protein (TIGR03085 family)
VAHARPRRHPRVDGTLGMPDTDTGSTLVIMTETTPLAVNHWARAERSALAELLEQVGPEAPTLCEGWATRDLAAHLVIRESRVDAAVGIAVPALAGYTQKVQDKAAAQPWATLVDKVRNGPPKFSMMRAEKVDGAANTIEFFVHHEDVRRAADGWEPRALDPRFEEVLWDRLKTFAPRLMKSSSFGIQFSTPDGRTFTVKDGPEAVIVTGEVADLTLFAYGRKAVNVEFHGTDEAVAAVSSGSFGI